MIDTIVEVVYAPAYSKKLRHRDAGAYTTINDGTVKSTPHHEEKNASEQKVAS
jgi:hypothetical protein